MILDALLAYSKLEQFSNCMIFSGPREVQKECLLPVDNEVKCIKENYESAEFPIKFINSIMRQFSEPQFGKSIPEFLFGDLHICLPHGPRSNKQLGHSTEQLRAFINN